MLGDGAAAAHSITGAIYHLMSRGDRSEASFYNDADPVEFLCLLLAKERWLEIELAAQPKGPPVKIEITQRLRHQTARSRQWIADRQGMGSSSYVSNLLGSVDSRL
jgi:hypothetical protein